MLKSALRLLLERSTKVRLKLVSRRTVIPLPGMEIAECSLPVRLMGRTRKSRLDPVVAGLEAHIIPNRPARDAILHSTPRIVGGRCYHKDKTGGFLRSFLALEEKIDTWNITKDRNLIPILGFDLSVKPSHNERVPIGNTGDTLNHRF